MREQEVSRRVREALRRGGFFVVPIESGGTAAGIPDLFAAGRGVATFIEVKSRPRMRMAGAMEASLEGKGQAAFAMKLCSGSRVTAAGCDARRHSFLLCSCSDGVLLARVMHDGTRQEAARMDAGEGRVDAGLLSAALEAFGLSVAPGRACKGMPVKEAALLAARTYSLMTGLSIDEALLTEMLGEQEAGGILQDERQALSIAFLVSEAARRGLMNKKENLFKEAVE